MAEASLRMAPLLPLPSLIEDLGFPAERLIAAAGVEPWCFGHPDNSISFSDAGRLLAHCAEQTGTGLSGRRCLVGTRCVPYGFCVNTSVPIAPPGR